MSQQTDWVNTYWLHQHFQIDTCIQIFSFISIMSWSHSNIHISISYNVQQQQRLFILLRQQAHDIAKTKKKQKKNIYGVRRESNSRPPAPETGIIPLDHWPITLIYVFFLDLISYQNVLYKDSFLCCPSFVVRKYFDSWCNRLTQECLLCSKKWTEFSLCCYQAGNLT